MWTRLTSGWKPRLYFRCLGSSSWSQHRSSVLQKHLEVAKREYARIGEKLASGGVHSREIAGLCKTMNRLEVEVHSRLPAWYLFPDPCVLNNFEYGVLSAMVAWCPCWFDFWCCCLCRCRCCCWWQPSLLRMMLAKCFRRWFVVQTLRLYVAFRPEWFLHFCCFVYAHTHHNYYRTLFVWVIVYWHRGRKEKKSASWVCMTVATLAYTEARHSTKWSQ